MNLVFVRALSGAIAVASVTIASALPTISFPSNALTTLFTNNGHGGFVRTGGSIGANMLNPLGATWGDFDNNGALDLFIANNNGDGTFTRVNVGPMTSDVTRSFTQAWADINNDGFPDVLITGVYTPRSLQGNDGNDNAWLTVRCVGRLSTRSSASVRA